MRKVQQNVYKVYSLRDCTCQTQTGRDETALEPFGLRLELKFTESGPQHLHHVAYTDIIIICPLGLYHSTNFYQVLQRRNPNNSTTGHHSTEQLQSGGLIPDLRLEETSTSWHEGGIVWSKFGGWPSRIIHQQANPRKIEDWSYTMLEAIAIRLEAIAHQSSNNPHEC